MSAANAMTMAVVPGGSRIDMTDVPPVAACEMAAAIDCLVAQGQGLAFLKGLDEKALDDLEHALWQRWPDNAELRLAVALRFRAVLAVFGAKRLRDLLLHRGFRVVKATADVAASERLNVRFGFRAQHFLVALERATTPHADIKTVRVTHALAA